MKVPILHLEDGVHHFEHHYAAGRLHFYREEVYPNEIGVAVELNKFERNITCKITLDTKAHYVCDRCLTDFEKGYHETFELLFHIGTEDLPTNEENVILIPPETVSLDLTSYIEEFLILTVPMKQLCSEDCKGICPGCGADLNTEECRCKVQTIDPRWAKLLELKKPE